MKIFFLSGLFAFLTIFLLLTTRDTFMDSVDEDQKVKSDLWSTLSF